MINIYFMAEIGAILLFAGGLMGTRRHFSRLPIIALILPLGRYYYRLIMLAIEPPGNQPMSDFLAQQWLLQLINCISISLLIAEFIRGLYCWRIFVVRRKQMRRVLKNERESDEFVRNV